MKKFKSIIFIVAVFCLCLCCVEGLTGCAEKEVAEIINTEAVITHKATEEQYDELASWFWEKPVYSTHYYFYVEYEGNVEEVEVERSEYYAYEVGDVYVLEVQE